MYDLNCPSCGTTYQSLKAGFCECCGYEFTEKYISELIATEKKKQKEIQEKITEEEKQRQLLLEKEKLEQRKKERQEKRDKIKTDLLHTWCIIEEYVGITISAIIALFIIIKTIVMSSTTGVTAGWIFFILLAIASAFVSGFAYVFFKNELTIGFTNVIPSGIIGAWWIVKSSATLFRQEFERR